MAVDLGGTSPRVVDEEPTLPAEVVEFLVFTQDVKCFHCGFVSGQFVGPPGLPRDARRFVPSPGVQPPDRFQATRPRCLRCGGPCFLDEVETSVRFREEALEKPKRGRKPKPRPVEP